MSEAGAFAVVLMAGAVTYLARVSFLFLMGGRLTSAKLQEVLRYIPAAAFAALSLPAVLVQDGAVLVGTANPGSLAAAAGLAIGVLTRNVLAVLVTGMGCLWLLRYLGAG